MSPFVCGIICGAGGLLALVVVMLVYLLLRESARSERMADRLKARDLSEFNAWEERREMRAQEMRGALVTSRDSGDSRHPLNVGGRPGGREAEDPGSPDTPTDPTDTYPSLFADGLTPRTTDLQVAAERGYQAVVGGGGA